MKETAETPETLETLVIENQEVLVEKVHGEETATAANVEAAALIPVTKIPVRTVNQSKVGGKSHYST